MAIRFLAAKRSGWKQIRKARTENSQEVLRRLEEYLKGEEAAWEPVKILCGFWQDQQDAITYQELRQVIEDGTLTTKMLELWQQDYSVLVSTKLWKMWENAILAGAGGQPLLDKIPFSFQLQTPGIQNWIKERGAAFVTASTQEQKDAVAALLTKKMRDRHTVDELSRLIRPCIGLTKGDAAAATKLYDSIVDTLTKEHPRMKPESIRKKALDSTLKYAERKHRARAMTIAQTESAFAYNRGADEGIRQAQAQGYLGSVIKRWSTSGDDQVCGLCASLDGMELGIDEDFEISGRLLFPEHHRLPPAHPRCACAVEYVKVESQNGIIESPMRTGDEWIDSSIDDYDNSLVSTNGDETMSIRLLMSHDEVKYEKDENMSVAFAYSKDRDVILYNPRVKNANDYDIIFALTHENAHRVDCLYLHSWGNENFLKAMNNAESLLISNLDVLEKFLQNNDYGNNFAFNDLISSLTRGKANDILFIGHDPEYLSNEQLRSMEVFADITCIDMGNTIVKKEFEGFLKELYEAYKEVAAWKT